MAALQFVRRSQGNSTRYLMSVLRQLDHSPSLMVRITDGNRTARAANELPCAVYDVRDRLRQEIVRQQSRVSDVNYT